MSEKKRGGCWRVPGDAMPREKRKMPAVSSRPVGVVVVRVPERGFLTSCVGSLLLINMEHI